MSASRSVREAGKRTTCLNNLKQIQSVIESYRKDHRKAPFSYEENKTADDYFSDFSFAADYISEGDLEVFHCPGDDNTKTMTSLDELSGGSSYLYIPSKSDLQDAGITNPTLAIEQMYLVVYDKHKENHNGNINILYLHGGGNPKGGVASTLKSGEYEWSIEELADNASDSDNDGSDDANDGNNGNDSNDANNGNGNDANDDGNNGHGNNDDGNDDSNPGNNGSNNNNDDANNSDGSDENSDNTNNDDGSEGSNNGNNDGKSNNGHGNNEDGVDSSNPGNSKDGRF